MPFSALGLGLLLVGGGSIGFLLALLGAGGSILLLPLLVSGASLPTREAVPLSMLVVLLLALGNLGPCLRRRRVALRPALLLGLPALLGSWIGGGWVKAGAVPEWLQLAVFAAAALLAARLLTRRRPSPLQGMLLMLPLLLGGALGAAAGQRLAPHLPEHRLRQGFAALLVGSALLTGGEAIQRQRAEGDAGAAESFSPQRALPDPAFPQASAPCPDARPPRPAVLRQGPLRG